ncbi:survival motor neuron protein [Rhipicephalus sanguineus]|uniref:survival motor neuron protein n=1 Tax=Rhipicephalus sanguineus TaxID=34632 RepID=UPI0020C3407B|nr:survival motor neuron protein [Rhipicephalus sanguineus]
MAKGTVLWRRTENADEDIWDDSDLIAAYDRAYEKIKAKIERRNRTSSENSSPGQEPSTGWKQGDYCIAVYSGDKLPYEAKIKCIRGKHCIVHYIGYGNEERVLLSDLHPSEGKKARQAQQARAGSTVHTSDVTSGSSQHCTGIPNLPSEPPWGAANLGAAISSSAYGTPPLPAHPPLFSENNAESDALSSMLMAWYMSGYHTGYYQALQESRQTQK